MDLETCFICGKKVGPFFFPIVIEVEEEVEVFAVCESCGYKIASIGEEDENNKKGGERSG
jgi:DNA-directed RNA polymerase subunit RPC12/RpoP